MKNLRPLTAAFVAALSTVAALCAQPAVGLAVPSASTVAQDRVAMQQAVNEYRAAKEQVDAVEQKVDAASRRLDILLNRQRLAQRRLDAHAAATYRAGPLSFLSVLTASQDFEDFSSRWFLLTRINQRDANAIAELKAARRRSISAARSLLKLQENATAKMRALDDTADKARARLENSEAAYAAYKSRVAAISASTPKKPRPDDSGDSDDSEQPDQTQTGAGGWQSAKASHYGEGSWGHKTADGTRIRPDSMIVAHKTLPFDTMVEFRYKGRTCVARVADRGPFIAGRVWDLGPGVVRVLKFNGVHTVKYRIIGR